MSSAKRPSKKGAGKPAPDALARLYSMRSWPRAPLTENGGIGLLYEFRNYCDPDFPCGDDQDRADLVAEVFRAFQRYLNHEAKSLDDAFNVKRPRGYRHELELERHRKRTALQVDGLILVDAGAAIDENLFKVLGKLHQVTQAKAREWYYEVREDLRERPRSFRNAKALPDRFRPHLHDLEWKNGKFPELEI